MASARSAILDYARRCGIAVAPDAPLKLVGRAPVVVAVSLEDGRDLKCVLHNVLGRLRVTAMHLYETGAYKGLVWLLHGYNLAVFEGFARKRDEDNAESERRSLPAPASSFAAEVEIVPEAEIEVLPPGAPLPAHFQNVALGHHPAARSRRLTAA